MGKKKKKSKDSKGARGKDNKSHGMQNNQKSANIQNLQSVNLNRHFPNPVDTDIVLADPLIFSAPNALSQKECASWIKFGETTGFVEFFQRETREYAFRDNGRIQFDSEAISLQLWNRLGHLLPPDIDGMHPCGMSPNIRIYRYKKGQRFGKHIDGSVQHAGGTWSLFTVLVYLNGPESGLRGGETVFQLPGTSEHIAVGPICGKALFHHHGERCLLHEGAEVKSGTKYLLRTDAIYKK